MLLKGVIPMSKLTIFINKYGYDEPIFINELSYEERFQIQLLIKQGKILSYTDDICFIPNPASVLKKKTLSVNKIIEKKYLFEQEKRVGYVTGLAFANKLGLTTQNPGIIEIKTMKETMEQRLVQFNKLSVLLRKPLIDITEENYKLLQVLDLITNLEKWNTKPLEEAYQRMKEYLNNVQLSSDELRKVMKCYPLLTQEKLRKNNLLT
jgi:hypothetical protein